VLAEKGEELADHAESVAIHRVNRGTSTDFSTLKRWKTGSSDKKMRALSLSNQRLALLTQQNCKNPVDRIRSRA